MAQFTKQAIAKSFLKLINKMPLDKITIRDIVEDCGINRNTFYYHFRDIYDLMGYVFREETREALFRMGTDVTTEGRICTGMRFALENKRAIYHIYHSISRELFDGYLYDISLALMQRTVDERARDLPVTQTDKQLVSELLACTLMGSTLSWVAAGMREELTCRIRGFCALFDGNELQNLLLRCADRLHEPV